MGNADYGKGTAATGTTTGGLFGLGSKAAAALKPMVGTAPAAAMPGTAPGTQPATAPSAPMAGGAVSAPVTLVGAPPSPLSSGGLSAFGGPVARQMGTTDAGFVDPYTGVQTGSRNPGSNNALMSRARPDQTVAERTHELRTDYLYGGREGAAQDAAASALATGQGYGSALQGAAQTANATGAAYGSAVANAGRQAGQVGQSYGDTLSRLGAGATNMGVNAGNRASDRFLDQRAASTAYGDSRAMAGTGSVMGSTGMAGAGDVGTTADQLKMLGSYQGPSQAQAQLNASTAQAMRGQLALARSGRGLAGGGAAIRNAQANQATIAGTANANAAVLRAQEDAAYRQRQLAAFQAAGGLQATGTGLALQGLSGQAQAEGAAGQLALGQGQYSTGAQQAAEASADAARLGLLGLGGQQMGAGAQADLQGQQLAMQGIGQGGQLALGGQQLGVTALGQGAGAELAGGGLANTINMGGLQGTTGYEQNITNWRGQDTAGMQAQMNADVQNRQIDEQNKASMWGMAGSALATGGSILGTVAPFLASDETLKGDVAGGGDSATDMLRGLETPEIPDPYSQGTGISGPNQIVLGPDSASGFGAAQATASRQKDLEKQTASRNADMASFGKQLAPSKTMLNDFVTKLGSTLGPKIFSDRTEKTEIRPAGGSAFGASLEGTRPPPTVPMRAPGGSSEEQLNAVRATDPYWFRYKQPEKYGEGQRFGIMAQDLAKTPVGRTAVERMPNGKLAVDTPQLTTINTGALSEQQKQIDGQQGALAELNSRVDAILSKLKGGKEKSALAY